MNKTPLKIEAANVAGETGKDKLSLGKSLQNEIPVVIGFRPNFRPAPLKRAALTVMLSPLCSVKKHHFI